MHGRRFCSATSCARRCFFTVSGKYEPPFTVASFATITHSRPSTTPIPVTMPALGAWPSYIVPRGERVQLEKRRPRIDEAVDPLPGEQLAARSCRSTARSPPPAPPPPTARAARRPAPPSALAPAGEIARPLDPALEERHRQEPNALLRLRVSTEPSSRAARACCGACTARFSCSRGLRRAAIVVVVVVDRRRRNGRRLGDVTSATPRRRGRRRHIGRLDLRRHPAARRHARQRRRAR